MKTSTERILVSHTGRLFKPDAGFVPMMVDYAPQTEDELRKIVGEIVRAQAEIGIDIINNGEYSMSPPQSWSAMVTGLEVRQAKPGEPTLKILSREHHEWDDFYAPLWGRSNRPMMGGPAAGMSPRPSELAVQEQGPAALLTHRRVFTGPIESKGTETLEREIQIFKDALKTVKAEEGFWCIISPSWLEEFTWNEYYDSEDDFIWALSAAMRPAFKAVTDAGLILQLDDPTISHCWEEAWLGPRSIPDYRKFITTRMEALNAALEGIPEDRVRYHVCWGSWNGPHVDNIPLREFVDIALKVRAQCLSLEAAKSSHRHDWKVWEDVKLPDDKILMPGVIDHTTNVVEHPEVVAEQIIRYANVVGKERVIAGTDCGMRGHARVNWAKYESMVKGAQIASKYLWGK